MNFSSALIAILFLGSVPAFANDSQFFFQARKNQFFLTPLFTGYHQDFALGLNSIVVTESIRRDYGMSFFAEYGLSDTISVEGGLGASYNTYKASVQSLYHEKVSYSNLNAVFLKLKGRSELPSLSFRYGIDVRIAVDKEPERALWDWGTTLSPYIGIQTAYDNGVVGLSISIDAVRTGREFISSYKVTTVNNVTDVQLGSSNVEGGQRVRTFLFAEGDDRRYDVGLAVGLEHLFPSTIQGQTFRQVENNILVRGYVVYEFLPKVNLVLDASGILGERLKRDFAEEVRRNQILVMAGVRMEL